MRRFALRLLGVSGIAVVLAAMAGAWRARPAPGVRVEDLAVEAKEGAGAPLEAPVETGRAETADQGCEAGYRGIDGNRCEPLQADGAPYSSAQLAKFRKMVESQLVSKANFLVPRTLSVDDTRKEARELARAKALAELVHARRATEDEIDEYFNFRERVVAFRMQILTYLHAETGGAVKYQDPDLDPDKITDPILGDYHRRLTSEAHRDYLGRKKARKDHGLPEEERIDWPGARL
jgi:hypothetical protein